MSDSTRQLHGQVIEGQRKYAYFLLAVAASAIALGVNRTTGLSLAITQIPLGAAVLLWSLSFLFGCRHLGYVTATLKTNAELLTIQGGEHPQFPPHPDIVQVARSTADENAEGASRNAKRQFGFLVGGAICYVAWHVLEMAVRTPALASLLAVSAYPKTPSGPIGSGCAL